MLFATDKNMFFSLSRTQAALQLGSNVSQFQFFFASKYIEGMCSFNGPSLQWLHCPRTGRMQGIFLCLSSQALVLITTPALNKSHMIENWQVGKPIFQFFIPAHKVIKIYNGFLSLAEFSVFPLGKKLADLCSPREGPLLS